MGGISERSCRAVAACCGIRRRRERQGPEGLERTGVDGSFSQKRSSLQVSAYPRIRPPSVHPVFPNQRARAGALRDRNDGWRFCQHASVNESGVASHTGALGATIQSVTDGGCPKRTQVRLRAPRYESVRSISGWRGENARLIRIRAAPRVRASTDHCCNRVRSAGRAEHNLGKPLSTVSRLAPTGAAPYLHAPVLPRRA